MDYLVEISTSLKDQKKNLTSTVSKLLKLKEKEIKTSITERWLNGESVNGGIIGSYRNPKYRALKIQQNPKAGGNVDLILTGKLKQGLQIQKQTSTEFLISSSDDKYDKLSEKYGKDEFGLTDVKREEIEEDILATVLDDFLEKAYE